MQLALPTAVREGRQLECAFYTYSAQSVWVGAVPASLPGLASCSVRSDGV